LRVSDEPTVSSPLFQKSAEELAQRLERDATEGARQMAREARDLAARFAQWGSGRPETEVRLAAIQALFDLHRRALDYLARRGPSAPPSAPSSRR
jgi:hypothetical protein